MGMKRSEVTIDVMKREGFKELESGEEPLIKDVVECIVSGFYKRFRLISGHRVNFTRTEYTMCSTYENSYTWEYLEVTVDGIEWFPVAKREKLIGRRCTYAD